MINKLGNIQSEKRLMIKGKVPENKIIPIKLKLIIICILFAIIPLIIVNTISSAISKKALRQTSQTLTAELVRQVSLNVEAFVDVVDSNITQFVVGGLTQDNLISNYSSEDQLEKFFAATEIQNKLTYIETIDKNISSTAIIFNDVEVLGKITDVTKEDLLTIKELEIENQSIWIKGLGKATDKLFFIKQVAASSKNVKCTIVVHVNLERIIQTMSDINLLENSRLYITDYSGKMIYSKDKFKTNADKVIWETLDKKIQFGTTFIQNTLVTYSVLPNEWYVIAEIPERSLTSQLDVTDITVWILILVLGVVAIIVGSIFASGVSNPIMKLMKLMKRVEEGDLTVKIASKGNDEISNLCHSFNHMITNIFKLLTETQAAVNHTLDNSKVLSISTQNSAQTFEQLAISIEDVAQGITYQAEDVQQSATAMTALSDNIQDVIQKTNTIYENNQGTKELIQIATKSIGLLTETMESSIQASTQIQTSILELSTLTKSIEDIMKLVDGISEQTNLLALNASIEAARVGEDGKGFAVVAHEVRHLAEQSKNSTVNVRKTLNTIENKTKDTVNLVKKSNSIFASQGEAVRNVQGTFVHIIHTLKNMDIEIGDVNDKVQVMKDLKDKMVIKIDNIAAVTQESAASIEEVNALSEEQKAVIERLYHLSNQLTTVMKALESSVRSFKLE